MAKKRYGADHNEPSPSTESRARLRADVVAIGLGIAAAASVGLLIIVNGPSAAVAAVAAVVAVAWVLTGLRLWRHEPVLQSYRGGVVALTLTFLIAVVLIVVAQPRL
jgi:hypothetical protein